MKRYAGHRHCFPSHNHSPIGLVHSSYRSELPYTILSSIKHRDPNVTVECGNDLRDVALVDPVMIYFTIARDVIISQQALILRNSILLLGMAMCDSDNVLHAYVCFLYPATFSRPRAILSKGIYWADLVDT